MAEAYTTNFLDTRAFGDLISALVDDLNRPDLEAQATRYAQDAIRYFSRQAFFFNEVDNTFVPGWTASAVYPLGSTIQIAISGTTYAFVATNTGNSGTVQPTFPATVFTPPPGAFPPPPSGTPGTVDDGAAIGNPPGPDPRNLGGVRWANVGPFNPQIYTNLCTVYGQNQYIPPLDYAIPRLVEVTWALNVRQPLVKMSYPELRRYDVIRPTPPTTYPVYWAWFQQQIYLWPWPVGFYPITLSYRTAPPVPTSPLTSNFWTTTAERLVRKRAQGIMERELLHDEDAAEMSLAAAQEELSSLRSQTIRFDQAGGDSGIPPSDW